MAHHEFIIFYFIKTNNFFIGYQPSRWFEIGFLLSQYNRFIFYTERIIRHIIVRLFMNYFPCALLSIKHGQYKMYCNKFNRENSVVVVFFLLWIIKLIVYYNIYYYNGLWNIRNLLYAVHIWFVWKSTTLYTNKIEIVQLFLRRIFTKFSKPF